MADPNHVLWHEERIVFLIPAKNAGTTIKVALCKLMGVEVPLSPDAVLHNDLKSPLTHIHQRDVPRGYRTVGVLREPLRRFWSSWAYLKKPWGRRNNRSLEAFFQDVERTPDKDLDQHIRAQSYDFLADGELVPKRWLVVESLDRDWRALCAALGWPETPLTRENATSPCYPYQASVVAPLAERIRARFADDVALYRDVAGV